MANEEVRLEGLETIENSAKKVADVVDANNGFLNHQKNMPKNVLVFFCCFVLNDRMWRNTKKNQLLWERETDRKREEKQRNRNQMYVIKIILRCEPSFKSFRVASKFMC